MPDVKGPEATAQPETKIDEKAIQGLIAKALEEQDEKRKGEIAGLNRKITELEKAKQELEKAKMTEAEKLDFERKEAEKARKLADDYRLNLMKTELFSREKLPYEFAQFVDSPDDASLSEKVKTLKELLHKTIEDERKRWEVEKIPNQRPPKSGGDVALTWDYVMHNYTEDQLKGMDQAQLKRLREEHINKGAK